MTEPAAVAEGAVVWFDHAAGGQTKARTAVVLRVGLAGGRAMLVYGTGTPRQGLRSVRVDPKTQAGKALRLVKTTYFYARNITFAEEGKLRPKGVRSPPELFLRLRELVGDARTSDS